MTTGAKDFVGAGGARNAGVRGSVSSGAAEGSPGGEPAPDSHEAPSGTKSETRAIGRVLVPNLDLEAIARDGIPALDWLAPGWLLPGDVVMLVGDSFAGKSTTASAIAIAGAIGGIAFDTIAFTRAMRVLYFDSETGDELLARQLLRLNGGQAIPTERLAVFSMLDFTLAEGGLADMAATIEASGGPCLVVMDSVAALFGLRDENAASEVGPALQSLRELAERTGSLMIVLHHANKPSGDLRFTRARKDRARGSTAFRGQCTVMMFQERTGSSAAVLEQSKRRGAALRSVVITYSEPRGEDGPIELSGEPIELSETKGEQLEDLLLEALEALEPGVAATTGQLQTIAQAAGHNAKAVSRTLGRLAKPSHGPPRVLKPKKGLWVLARASSATDTDRTRPDSAGEGEA